MCIRDRAQCIDLSDENGFFSWLLNFLFGWLGKDESQPEPAYSGWRTSGGKTYYYSPVSYTHLASPAPPAKRSWKRRVWPGRQSSFWP